MTNYDDNISPTVQQTRADFNSGSNLLASIAILVRYIHLHTHIYIYIYIHKIIPPVQCLSFDSYFEKSITNTSSIIFKRDGDDGYWSSFTLRVGTPEQLVRVLISTTDYNTKVVSPVGCPADTPGITPSETCPQSRGELFDASRSSTWDSFGNYSLDLDVNLGYDAPASYGLDTVALGLSNATGGPTLRGQVVASLETYNFYTGLFGLGNQPSNFTASNDPRNFTDTTPYTSFLTTMKNQSLIPSLSWAYTAGAKYSESTSIHEFRMTYLAILQSLRGCYPRYQPLCTDPSTVLESF